MASKQNKKTKKVRWNTSANKPFEHYYLADLIDTFFMSDGDEQELSCEKIKAVVIGAAAAGVSPETSKNSIQEVPTARKIIAYLKRKKTYLGTHKVVSIGQLRLKTQHGWVIDKVREAFEKCYPVTSATKSNNNSAGGEESKASNSGQKGGKRRRRSRTRRRRRRRKTKRRKHRRRKHSRKR